MKILKLKSTLFSLMAIAMVTVFLSSCEKDFAKVQPNEHIDKITLDQLKTSQQMWNEQFSEKITLLNYEYVKTIENEQDKQDMLKNIADDAKVVATGDLDQPESLKVEVLKENSAKATITKDNLRKYIKDEIKISNKVIALNWDKNGEQFTTYCISNKDGIVWDNILGGVMAIELENNEEIGNSSGVNKSGDRYYNWYRHDWRVRYFWGDTAGRFGYKITVHHNGSRVSNTDNEDYAWMQFGKAVSETKILNNSGQFGRIQYALAVAGPGGDVSFDRGGFKASVSGIGYTDVANGTKTLYPKIY